ncbi:MAG: histidine kinase dimerization/phospho-acceptor domain-containing protein, partial [Bacteroidota bacterium]
MEPVKPFIATCTFFQRLIRIFHNWEANVLSHYPEEPSYDRRVARHLFRLVVLVTLISVFNRFLHPIEGNFIKDFSWELAIIFMWLFNIYLIKRKKIQLLIFLYYICATTLYFVHFIVKDYYATDLTFVHPYHVFEVGLLVVTCGIFISFKFDSPWWLFFMSLYSTFIIACHGYAISQHYPSELVITLTAICIFSVLVAYIGIHFTAGFLHKQREIIEQQQAEIEKKNQALANRVSDLRNFAYIASHDLKAPLRSIISFQDLLKRQLEKREDTNSLFYLEHSHKGARQLENILKDLSAYTRLSNDVPSAAFQKVNLARIVEIIKQEAASIHEKNHKINILGSLPEVYAVESYMKIVLQNLILNGLKYN